MSIFKDVVSQIDWVINMEEEKMLNMENVIPIEKSRGRPKKENKNQIVPISMPLELLERIKKQMDIKEKKNRSDFICTLLIEYLNLKALETI